MSDYTVMERPGPGLAFVHSRQYLRQLFAEVRLRKNCVCANCEEAVQKSAAAYRPVGNPMNRYVRLCGPCVEGREYAPVR